MPSANHPRIVFTEIPATDPERACRFYEQLLGTPLVKDDNGPNPVWLFSHAEGEGAAGHIYPGKPAPRGEGMTVHFEVRDTLADAMARVTRGGGSIVSEVIDIYVGAFFYAEDSEGNSLGLFKYKS